ncbi:MAG: GGDEF domain-containing protein [Oxalobacter sp.]|nr:MAG: GGDEF domain-containing protein [Oxalobacter sp.]
MKKTPPPQDQNPALIAREVFRLLGQRRISPTPEAYRALYHEIAGTQDPDKTTADKPGKEPLTPEIDQGTLMLLSGFARKMSGAPGDAAELGYRFQRAVKSQDWEDYTKTLNHLFDKYVRPAASAPLKPTRLVEMPTESQQLHYLRDLLVRTLTFTVVSLLQDAPDLAGEAEELGALLKSAQAHDDFEKAGARLKRIAYKIEMKTGNTAEQQELLVRLFNLLLDNIGELLEDDSWLRGQITVIQNLISGPLNYRMLEDAETRLKEVIYKQGILKHSLTEAKDTLKNMMITFVDRMGDLAASTTQYQQKMETYSQKISKAKHITELSSVMEDVLRETRLIQEEARHSRDKILAARREANDAESRIKELENKLERMSELVREDQLTGSLNRRGLDDVYEREAARADRRNSPICVALLDLDNFKMLNDTYGHFAGDEALIHLVRVVKETLRPTDVIARFGGEEFLLVLPDTKIEDATQTMMRVQRALTKHFFMYKNEQILITFSAGVAQRLPGEDQDAVTNRADAAMYRAKKAGKNRVFAAE